MEVTALVGSCERYYEVHALETDAGGCAESGLLKAQDFNIIRYGIHQQSV